MKAINENEEIVIRPSGVWNTRSPLIQFNRHNHDLNQAYYSTLLAITGVQSAGNKLGPSAAASDLFPHKTSHSVARRAWSAFKRSFPSQFDGSRRPLTVEDVQKTTRLAIAAITEHTIVKCGALFESFAQCWALNYLLARLESGEALTQKERSLIHEFSPVQSTRVPGWPAIFKAIPGICTELSRVPHLKTDPRTGEAVDAPLTPVLNAFTVIGFWREWRNSLVHRSGVVSTWFFNVHGPVWEELQDLAPTNKDLDIGHKLPLDDSTFRAVAAVHARAAKSRRDILVKVSGERRGHVLAPKPSWKSGRMPPEMMPDRLPPLLLRGDHESSLLWSTDEVFRKRMRMKLTKA